MTIKAYSKTSLLALLTILVLAAALTWLRKAQTTDRSSREKTGQPSPVASTLSGLIALSDDARAHVDIAEMNLLCAQGLPGSEDLDLTGSFTALDQMAARVRAETDRHFYRFREHPAEFESSEGYFRMIMLAVVLVEDFGVQYTPTKRGAITDAHAGDGFFSDAHDVFLHGLTGPKRLGTCSSLPVLQIAVGRRLGYPLKLVATKGHLFVRWEGKEERFNIEAAGKGVNRYEDDYYRHWPVEVSDEEIRSDGYLKSLTSTEELAVFLSIRGMCLWETHRDTEALESFKGAEHLVPECQSYHVMVQKLGGSTRIQTARQQTGTLEGL